MRAEGLEPTLLAEQGPKPCASASFATPAAVEPAYATAAESALEREFRAPDKISKVVRPVRNPLLAFGRV